LRTYFRPLLGGATFTLHPSPERIEIVPLFVSAAERAAA
jgi:hypothetical protein